MPRIVTLTMNPALDIATATEEVVPTVKLRCDEPRYDPGGGGINVARAVHFLGGDALAVFPVGGLSGEMLCRLLADEGVPHDAVTIAGLTRESLAVVETQQRQTVPFFVAGPDARRKRPATLPRHARHMPRGGSVSGRQRQPPARRADGFLRRGRSALAPA